VHVFKLLCIYAPHINCKSQFKKRVTQNIIETIYINNPYKFVNDIHDKRIKTDTKGKHSGLRWKR